MGPGHFRSYSGFWAGRRWENCPAVTGMYRTPPTPGTIQVDQAARILLHAGLVLLIAGAALLGGYWVFVMISEVVGDSDIPLAVRIGLPALGAGGLLLLAGVLIEQIRRNRREDFRKVEH